MKEYLAELVRNQSSPVQGRNVTREYLQARILGGLQRSGAMIPLAFQRGTCLRFLYSIPRFSEDLDFALERPEAEYDLRSWLKEAQKGFTAEGYRVGIKVSDSRTVHSAFIRFYGLPYELGLSRQPEEAFSVKIVVDTEPPAGAGLENSLVRRYETLNLQHHDRASLLAGKLHALLQRPYGKGRDIYDLVWCFCDPGWPPPNLVLLRNALAQTGWAEAEATSPARAIEGDELGADPGGCAAFPGATGGEPAADVREHRGVVEEQEEVIRISPNGQSLRRHTPGVYN